MDLSVLKPIGGAMWFIARTFNPLRLYQASPQTRLAVAGSILGLGTAGGVASVMMTPDAPNKETALVAPEEFQSGPQSLIASPVQPLPDSADRDARPLGPPPTNMFSSALTSRNSLRATDGAAAPSNDQFAPPEPSRFAGDTSSRALRTRVLEPREAPIQQVTDNAPVDANPVEPGPLPGREPPPVAVSIGDAEPPPPSRPSPFPRANFADTNPAVDTAAAGPPATEPVPPQEIPPPKPQFRSLNQGGALGAPPEFSPPPGNRFEAPPTNYGAPPPANLSLPPTQPAPSIPSNNPPAVPETTLGGGRPRSGLGGNAFGGSSLSANVAPEAASLVSATPGAKQLDGVQSPSLTLEKFVTPADVQVGKPTTFQLKLRNAGQVVAHNVVVMDQVPAGTRFAESNPQTTPTADGTLLWKIGTLQPGDSQVITMQVVPEREGEIGSVAQVMFQAQASARAISTRPQLSIKLAAQQKVLIGQSLMLNISVTNTGTGPATDLVLSALVPEVLNHAAGTELEYEIGTLPPGQSKQVSLTLKAVKAGVGKSTISAGNETNAKAADELQIEVIAPQLELAINGPKVRYLERQATYSVLLANPGTAPANNVELVTFLPRGFKFLSADNNGQYDAQNHAVFWSLEQLPPEKTGEVQITALPVEIGEQKFRVESRADLGLQKVFEQPVQVEGLSELQFSVADVADPIEVGTDTVYEIKLTNRGHKPATNVQLAVAFPPELQPVSGEGPSRVTVTGPQITIEPLARMAPSGQAIYKITARGLRPGDPRLRVQLMSDESPNPVLKEESTRVYADK